MSSWLVTGEAKLRADNPPHPHNCKKEKRQKKKLPGIPKGIKQANDRQTSTRQQATLTSSTSPFKEIPGSTTLSAAIVPTVSASLRCFKSSATVLGLPKSSHFVRDPSVGIPGQSGENQRTTSRNRWCHGHPHKIARQAFCSLSPQHQVQRRPPQGQTDGSAGRSLDW